MVDAVLVPMEAGVGNLAGIEEALVPVHGGAAGKREVCHGGTSSSHRRANGPARTRDAPPRQRFYPHCTAGSHPASLERARGPAPQVRARKVWCPCDKSEASVQQKRGTRAAKARHSCNKIETLRLDFASWPCSNKSQLGFYLLLHECHFTKMDSNGSFQPQNLKFVACKARLASGDASDTRISRPSQHAKAHGLCGNDTHRHDAIRRATRMGKRAPPTPVQRT